MTGQPLIAYSWILNESPSNFKTGSLETLRALVQVTLPNGKTFSDETTLFV
ncbi:MAG: hypothetical protein H0X03_07685 [Nitrosopumilus sp.]|nr:hypothetical protein [Nitrosopumilus sp.]